MIIIPTTTGSPAAPFVESDYPLTHPRIGWHSYTRDVTASSVTVSSASDDGPGDAPLRPDTFEFWEPTLLPATWELTLDEASDLDYVGIASHTIGTKGCTVLVETSTDGLNYSEFSDSHTPDDDSPILFIDASRSVSKIRITISGGSPSGDCPRIAVIHAGEILKMELGLAGGTPVVLARETVLKRTLSKGGQFLGQTFQRNGYRASASFRGLTPSWYRTNFEPFVSSARRFPFFFAWNPEEFPDDIVYAWAMGDISPNYMGVDPFFEVSWSMQAIDNG